MLRRLGIRAKVLAVLAVPIIVLLIAGAYISNTSIQKVRAASASAQVVEVLDQYAPVSAALQAERAVTTASTIDKDKLAAARAATDKALAAVRPYTAKVDLSQFARTVVTMFQRSQRAHDVDLPDVRHLVDTEANRAVIESKYTLIIGSEIDLVSELSQVFANRDLAAYVTTCLL